MSKKVNYTCAACGITSRDKPVYFRSKYNQCLCRKHYEQMRIYSKFIDTSPYGVYDKNRYIIDGDVVRMEITDAHQNKICDTLYDTCFFKDVSGRKWRQTIKNGKPYIATLAYPYEQSKHITLHRYIAILAGWDINGFEIDHINGDPMDNRLCNLRCATRHEQVSNIAPKYTNKFGIRGISFDKRYQKYVIDFRLDGMRLYFKPVKTLPEAVYIRHLAEKHFFDEVAINRHLPEMQPYIDQLTEYQKRELEDYVNYIIAKKESVAS